jgi:hypothetical protein
VTRDATRKRGPQVLAILVTFLLLVVSLPFGDGLSLRWFSALLLLLVSALLKWGPRLLALGFARIGVLGALAVFLSSLINRSVERGDGVVIGTVIGILLLLFIIVSRSEAMTATSAYLRTFTLCSMALLTLSLKWSGHRVMASMKQGDFWMVNVPFLNRLVLPHPYDFYIVSRLIPCIVLVSLVCSVMGSGLYFLRRNSELKRKGAAELRLPG